MSQSPEGSSRHFSNRSCPSWSPRPMASQSPEGSSRHFSGTTLGGISGVYVKSQSPEGSSRHFSWKRWTCRKAFGSCLNRPKALLVISAEKFFEVTLEGGKKSQSPEGSSRHFSRPHLLGRLASFLVSIARRLFSSFQLRASFIFSWPTIAVSIARRLFSSFQLRYGGPRDSQLR